MALGALTKELKLSKKQVETLAFIYTSGSAIHGNTFNAFHRRGLVYMRNGTHVWLTAAGQNVLKENGYRILVMGE